MMSAIVLADIVAVISLQLAENNRGKDSQSAKAKERLMDFVNHFRRVVMKAVQETLERKESI